jgi:MoxR-like ATPase
MNKTIQILKDEVKKIVVGQDELIDSIIIGIITQGHILVEGMPGLAKTTTVNAFAKALGLEFKRIQFTPDLLPSDIIGSQIYNQKEANFSIKKGPVFTNLLLADEINRAPAKVQSALLEVMQEKQVTIGEESFKVDRPFLVLATQNPVEQEGVYKLPEAQLDRFMLKVSVGYNSLDEEFDIINRVANDEFKDVHQVVSKDDIKKLQEDIKQIHIDKEIQKYILRIVFATREPLEYGLDQEYASYIECGVSPRASIDLYNASKAVALLRDKEYVTPLDIATVVTNVLQHRLILSYKAQAKNITPKDIVQKILEVIKAP